MINEADVGAILDGRVFNHMDNSMKDSRIEAVRVLNARGLNDVQIAKTTNMTERTVGRLRAELGVKSPVGGTRRLPWVESDPKRRCGAMKSPTSQSPCLLVRGHRSDPALPDEHMGLQPMGSNWVVWTKEAKGWNKKWTTRTSSSSRPSRRRSPSTR